MVSASCRRPALTLSTSSSCPSSRFCMARMTDTRRMRAPGKAPRVRSIHCFVLSRITVVAMPPLMSLLPQYQTTRPAREEGTTRSKNVSWFPVREPPKARLVTGIGARSAAKVVHLRKILLPTRRTPPGAGAGAKANLATASSYLFFAGAGCSCADKGHCHAIAAQSTGRSFRMKPGSRGGRQWRHGKEAGHPRRQIAAVRNGPDLPMRWEATKFNALQDGEKRHERRPGWPADSSRP